MAWEGAEVGCCIPQNNPHKEQWNSTLIAAREGGHVLEHGILYNLPEQEQVERARQQRHLGHAIAQAQARKPRSASAPPTRSVQAHVPGASNVLAGEAVARPTVAAPPFGLPMVICRGCGAHASAGGKPQGLLDPCHKPTEAGKRALARARRGLHPKAGREPLYCTLDRQVSAPSVQ